METVANLILKVRSRTQDKTADKWSDEELVDAINSAYIKLSSDLLLFTNTKTITTIDGVNRYPLPYGLIKAISYKLNGTKATIKSFEWIANNDIDDFEFVVVQDEKSFYIYPEDVNGADKIKVIYNYVETISKQSDELKVPLYAQNALLFYTMHLVHQIGNVSGKQTDKSMQYLQLYYKEIDSAKSLLYKNKHSRNLRSRFVKV